MSVVVTLKEGTVVAAVAVVMVVVVALKDETMVTVAVVIAPEKVMRSVGGRLGYSISG